MIHILEKGEGVRGERGRRGGYNYCIIQCVYVHVHLMCNY